MTMDDLDDDGPDMFAAQQLSREDQVAACQRMVEAVDAVVAHQFRLGHEVLRHAVACQTDAYRALHEARSLRGKP